MVLTVKHVIDGVVRENRLRVEANDPRKAGAEIIGLLADIYKVDPSHVTVDAVGADGLNNPPRKQGGR